MDIVLSKNRCKKTKSAYLKFLMYNLFKFYLSQTISTLITTLYIVRWKSKYVNFDEKGEK